MTKPDAFKKGAKRLSLGQVALVKLYVVKLAKDPGLSFRAFVDALRAEIRAVEEQGRKAHSTRKDK